MCDYSLHHVASRPAKVGDELVSTRFQHSITGGFAAIAEPNTAVCLRPGTEVVFAQEVTYDRPIARVWPWSRPIAVGHRVARFRQVNTDHIGAHHDALEFPDGRVVLVTRLTPGQRATVIQLPASLQPAQSQTAAEPEPHVLGA
jgi:hypothetical protein